MNSLNIIFDGAPGATSGRFVEVEDETGKSVNVGTWSERENGMWALTIKQAPDIPMTLCGHGSLLCARCGFIPESWKPQL